MVLVSNCKSANFDTYIRSVGSVQFLEQQRTQNWQQNLRFFWCTFRIAINFSDWFAKLSERDPQARPSISTREVGPTTTHHDAQLWLNAPSDTPDASRKKSLSAQNPKVGRGKANAESH